MSNAQIPGTASNNGRDSTNKPPLKVLFLHLDLGIGGAEQLVLQLATASQSLGHDVTLLTTKCDAHHCFAAVKPPDGVLVSSLQVWGRWIPSSIFGLGGTALCSNTRVLYLALCLLMGNGNASGKNGGAVDLVVIDVLPSPLWLLQLFTNCSLLFYCHFPDKLLIRKNPLEQQNQDQQQLTPPKKSIYRRLMDGMEEYCMPLADTVLVNSKFTQKTVLQEFPSAFSSEQDLQVLYPALDTKAIDAERVEAPQQQSTITNDDEYDPTNYTNDNDDHHIITIVSLNRYERKKKIDLILRAYALIRDEYPTNSIRVIIAGGYDTTNVENVEYRGELEALAFEELQLDKVGGEVKFLTSISDAKRTQLLQTARCVVYTPPNEHFGIVPLEVMYAGTPVIACNSGGPLETVVDGTTGFLCDPTPEAFAKALHDLLRAPRKAQDMGRNGRRHVADTFGTERLAHQWNIYTQQAYERGQDRIYQQHSGGHRPGPAMIRMIRNTLLHLRDAGLALVVWLLVTFLFRHAGWLEHDESILGLMRRRFQSDEL